MLANLKTIQSQLDKLKLSEFSVKQLYKNIEDWEIEDKINERERKIEEVSRIVIDLETTIGANAYWNHQSDLAQFTEKNLTNIGTHWINTINNDADWYFVQKEVRSVDLDWLLIQILIVLTYLNQKKAINEKISNFLLPDMKIYVANWFDGKYIAILIQTLMFLIKWIVLLSILIALFANSSDNVAYGLLGCGFIFYWLYVHYKNKMVCNKYEEDGNEKLLIIQRVYDLVASSNVHWDILEKELDTTRISGVTWPSALYTAIKQNKK
jgi:hypothetical protein